MPKKSGLDCLRKIKSEYKFDQIPIIIYSTSQNKKDIERFLVQFSSHKKWNDYLPNCFF